MSGDTPLEFETLELDWATLRRLPKEQLAALGLLSFAVNEVNVLRKMYLSHSHNYTGVLVADSAINIQSFTVLRSWSSKLFEVSETLRVLKKEYKVKDKVLLRLAAKAVEKFQQINILDSFEVARYLRNEAGHHYSFSAALRNIDFVSKDADFSVYTHDQGANDFFPLGEELLFQARLNRKWSNVPSKIDREKLFKGWLDWNLAATDWLMDSHAKFYDKLVFTGLGMRNFERLSWSVPKAMVGEVEGEKSPVFRIKRKQ